MRVNFGREFEKRLRKAPEKVRAAFVRRLKTFRSDKFNALLNNHALKGKYGGCRSINVTGDWRAVYKDVGKDWVLFVEIGTHSQLYK